MRGLIMEIGPEETSCRVVLLYILMALQKTFPKGVAVQKVHRTLRIIENRIREMEHKQRLPALIRTRFVFVSEAGRFPFVDKVLQELAIYGIATLVTKGEIGIVEFNEVTAVELADAAKRLCKLEENEVILLNRLAEAVPGIYKGFTD